MFNNMNQRVQRRKLSRGVRNYKSRFLHRILIFIFAITSCYTKGYALQVGLTAVTFIDSTRNNRQIETKIYYPAVTAGNIFAASVKYQKTTVAMAIANKTYVKYLLQG